MSEALMIFTVSFFVGLVGVLLPQYMLHLLRMRRMKQELAQDCAATLERMILRSEAVKQELQKRGML